MRYYFKAFKNYFNASGRANRKEIWLFLLFNYIVSLILSFFSGFFGLYSAEIDYGYLTLAYIIIALSPSICLQIRRLHDVGKSGAWLLGYLVPFLNLYVLCLVYFVPGTSGINEYGIPSGRKEEDFPPEVNSLEKLTVTADMYKFVCTKCNALHTGWYNECPNCKAKGTIKRGSDEDIRKWNNLPESAPSVEPVTATNPQATTATISPIVTTSSVVNRPSFCSNCGAHLNDGQKFCSGCGTKITFF